MWILRGWFSYGFLQGRFGGPDDQCVQTRDYGIEQWKVEREKQCHRQAEISFAEKPVEDVVRIGVAAVQSISSELEQTHWKKPVKILLPPGKLSQHDGNRQYVEHIHRDYLPPENKLGYLQPLPNLVHYGSGQEVRDGVDEPVNSREPEFLAETIDNNGGASRHKQQQLENYIS